MSAPFHHPSKAVDSVNFIIFATTRRAVSICRFACVAATRSAAAHLAAVLACSSSGFLPRVQAAIQSNATPAVTERNAKRRSATAVPSTIWRSSRSTASVILLSRSLSSSSSRRPFLSSRASIWISVFPSSTACNQRSKKRNLSLCCSHAVLRSFGDSIATTLFEGIVLCRDSSPSCPCGRAGSESVSSASVSKLRRGTPARAGPSDMLALLKSSASAARVALRVLLCLPRLKALNFRGCWSRVCHPRAAAVRCNSGTTRQMVSMRNLYQTQGA